VLVAGMTQMGKTNFLRLLLDQVIQEGARIQLVDPKAQFNSLRRHPARLTPAPSSYDDHRTALAVMESVVAELHHRIELFTAVHEDGLTLDRYNALASEPLPRVFVVVDEFSGLVSAAGGPKSDLSALVEQVAWHGAGLGLHLVLAGQAFDRELVGRVRDQAALRFCFRVEAPSLSRMIVGRAGAERLPVPGRALSTLGVIQTYRIEAMTTTQGPVPGLTPDELARAAMILREHGGRLTSLAITRVWGVSNRQAQQISREWRARGLAAKNGASDNAVMLVPELVRQLEEAVRADRV
jgi:S-DNA-T family DNA segregation ATPase FtsK/SpoIIIE